MRRIVLDTTGWDSRRDFYDALLPALQAPPWHGDNLDALWDSVRGGDINGLRPPYIVHLAGSGPLPPELQAYIREFLSLMEEARGDGVEVSATADAALCLPQEHPPRLKL